MKNTIYVYCKMVYIKYVCVLHEPLTVRSEQAWHGKGRLLGKDDICDSLWPSIWIIYLSSWLRYRTNRPVCCCPRSRRPCVFGPASSVSASAPARWPPPRSGSLSRVVGRSPPRFVSPARPDLPYPAHSGSLPYRPGSRPYRPASTGRCCCRRPLLRTLSRRGWQLEARTASCLPESKKVWCPPRSKDEK